MMKKNDEFDITFPTNVIRFKYSIDASSMMDKIHYCRVKNDEEQIIYIYEFNGKDDFKNGNLNKTKDINNMLENIYP
jgi:hypothetical protein